MWWNKKKNIEKTITLEFYNSTQLRDYNKQFNRIFACFLEYGDTLYDFHCIATSYKNLWNSLDEYDHSSIFEKIRILSWLFTFKKDNKYLFLPGDRKNPEYEYMILKKNLKKELEGVQEPARHYVIESIPVTIRDLFMANCIPLNNKVEDRMRVDHLRQVRFEKTINMPKNTNQKIKENIQLKFLELAGIYNLMPKKENLSFTSFLLNWIVNKDNNNDQTTNQKN